jgi:hypothetical protein
MRSAAILSAGPLTAPNADARQKKLVFIDFSFKLDRTRLNRDLQQGDAAERRSEK